MPVAGGLRRSAIVMIMKIVPVSMSVSDESAMIYAVKMIHSRDR